jgi:hypothetical protein
MAIGGTEADAEHSCGQFSERGKQVWRTNGLAAPAAVAGLAARLRTRPVLPR